MLKNILFDFDGVIHDTFDFHLDAINRYAPHTGLSADEYRRLHDGSIFDNSPLSEQRRIDFSAYPQFIAQEFSQISASDHVLAHLTELAQQYALFLVTSGGRASVLPFLQINKLEHLFTDLLYKEQSLSKVEKFTMLFEKHGAHPGDSVFVTDTTGDIIEAHEVQLPTIAVTFGFHTRARLAKAAPEAIVDSWSQLVALLQDSDKMNLLLINN